MSKLFLWFYHFLRVFKQSVLFLQDASTRISDAMINFTYRIRAYRYEKRRQREKKRLELAKSELNENKRKEAHLAH